MREQTKEKKSQADARRLSGSAYNLLLSLDPLYYSVVSDAQCEKERKKEREITVLTLLVEALSHMSQSHSPSLSLSSNHHPLILSSTTSDKETVLRIIP